MSAISGLWHLDERPGAADLLDSMQDALKPFGPDRQGVWAGGTVALGSRLTLLLPEDVHDRQPLVGGGGRYVLVADLRLDNRPELVHALGIDARQAGAMADADMLLAAWERWQQHCPSRLIGNFAFALWDQAEHRLHLVRDQTGERPLFYHQSPNRIAFASMYHGLHALPDVQMAPDLGAVRAHAAFFADYRDRSYFAGIKRVMPGSHVEIDAAGTVRIERYWDLSQQRPQRRGSDAEHIEAFRDTLDRAVHDRLRAIGPIGCHLSSGYDSSAVAATAARMLAERGQRLTAYTAVPMADVPLQALPGQIIDESVIASATAAMYPNVDHILVGRDGRALGEDFEVAFQFWRQPLRNLCNRVWRTEIAQTMQARGERVLLNAIFGNLTISYNGREVLPEMVAAGQWRRLVQELRLLSRNEASVLRLLQSTFGPYVPPPVLNQIRRMTGRTSTSRGRYSPLSERAMAAILAEETEGRWEHMSDLTGQRYATRHSRIRLGLCQADIGAHNAFMLAAYGTDERDASRDMRLIELVLSLPPQMFIQNGQARWVYRQALAGRVSPQVMMPLSQKGQQSADWMYRLHRGRQAVNAVLERAQGNKVIEEMFDMPGLRLSAKAELDFSRAHLPEIRDPLRQRFLTGIANIDFLLRAGLGPTA
ncbi:MAG TPA: asparagine synthetase B [Magnetospirillum sp.]|nr:asparagine synthetase B [Magnetospirillum sp.]